MSKRYHTLIAKRDNVWTIEFGDYQRDVVKQEQEDTKERGVQMRIITSGDTQAEIIAAVDRQNGVA